MSTRLRFQNADISFLFTTNRGIQKYHKQFLNDPSPTDVITFTDGKTVDAVISLDQAVRQAGPRGVRLWQEAALLVGHALLHAKGFDDLTEKGRLEMRRQEFELMASVF